MHGLTGHPLYFTWLGIRARCCNPDSRSYKWYGARGIGMHDEWLHDPAAFIAWIEENLGPRPAGRGSRSYPLYTLDRIDNDGGYEPGNLRWATKAVQQGNRRRYAPRAPLPDMMIPLEPIRDDSEVRSDFPAWASPSRG